MAYYLIRGGGGRFVLTQNRPKLGVTLVTFPPLPAKEGRFQIKNGWLEPVVDPKRTPVEVRVVPPDLGARLAELKKRHEDLLAASHAAYVEYLRTCHEVYPSLAHAAYPAPEEPS